MVGFTKLHGLILDSSIWDEPDHVRLVWITMLAMADRDGIVQASVGGLAHRARVTREKTLEALSTLMGPDPDSRDGTTGERVAKVPGGWLLLNYHHYRDKQTQQQRDTAARVRKHRAKVKAEADTKRYVTRGNSGNAITHPEAEAEAEAEVPRNRKAETDPPPDPPKREATAPPRPSPPRVPDRFEEFWDVYGLKVKRPKAVEAWRKATRGKPEMAERIITAARAYRAWLDTGDTPQAHPTTWLNQGRWDDELQPQRARGGAKPPMPTAPPPGAYDAEMEGPHGWGPEDDSE